MHCYKHACCNMHVTSILCILSTHVRRSESLWEHFEVITRSLGREEPWTKKVSGISRTNGRSSEVQNVESCHPVMIQELQQSSNLWSLSAHDVFCCLVVLFCGSFYYFTTLLLLLSFHSDLFIYSLLCLLHLIIFSFFVFV